MSQNPLPFPADEIRQLAIDQLTNCQLEVGRLIRFFRGHQKDASVLEAVAIRLMSNQMSLHNLKWDATNCEEPFPTPPTPRPQDAHPDRTEPPASHSAPPPSAPN